MNEPFFEEILRGDPGALLRLDEEVRKEMFRRIDKEDKNVAKVFVREAIIDTYEFIKKNKEKFQNSKEIIEFALEKAFKRFHRKRQEVSFDQKIMEALKNNDGWAYYYIQVNYFPAVTAMILLHGGSEEEAKDVIMDGIYALIKNIREGKYVLQSSARLKSYFLRICKNIWFDRVKTHKRRTVVSIDEVIHKLEETSVVRDEEIKEEILTPRQKIVEELLAASTGKCKELLILYYYHNLSHQEIAKKMGYSSADTSKNRKLKCIKQLKEIIRKRLQNQNRKP